MADQSGGPHDNPCTAAEAGSILDPSHVQINKGNVDENISYFFLQKIKELEENQARLKEELARLTQMHDSSSLHSNHLVSASTSGSTSWCTCNCSCHSSSLGHADTSSLGGGQLWHNVRAIDEYPHMQTSNPNWHFRSTSSSSGSLTAGRRSVHEDLSAGHFVNILQSMGQAVYIFRPTGEVTYWNRCAEDLYGWKASEAIGQNILDLVVDEARQDVAAQLVSQLGRGESWSGQFPLKKKTGEVFVGMMTDTPLYDGDQFVGIIGVSSDTRPFKNSGLQESDASHVWGPPRLLNGIRGLPKLRLDRQQPLSVPFKNAMPLKNTVSKVASKVLSRLRIGDSAESGPCEEDRNVVGGKADDNQQGIYDQAVVRRPENDALAHNSLVEATSKPESSAASLGQEKKGVGGHAAALSSKAEAWMPKNLKQKLKTSLIENSLGDQNFFKYTCTKDQNSSLSKPDAISPPKTAMSDIGAEEGATALSPPTPAQSGSVISQRNGCGSSNSTCSLNGTLHPLAEADSGLEDCEIAWSDLSIREHIGEGTT